MKTTKKPAEVRKQMEKDKYAAYQEARRMDAEVASREPYVRQEPEDRFSDPESYSVIG